MVLDESVRLCLLNDFYGALLTKNQQQVLDSYLNYNLSLVEISQNFGITRQAVLDTIKKASKKLEEYEKKLGMLNKYLVQNEIADKIKDAKDYKSSIKKLLDVWHQD